MYREKYLKYKFKYTQLKNTLNLRGQIGGSYSETVFVVQNCDTFEDVYGREVIEIIASENVNFERLNDEKVHKNMSYLRISEKLTDENINTFKGGDGIKNLRLLSLDSNTFTSIGMNYMFANKNIKNLRILRLVNTNLQNSDLDLIFSNLPDLVNFTLMKNDNITNEGFRYIGKLELFMDIYLNSLSKITDEIFLHLKDILQNKTKYEDGLGVGYKYNDPEDCSITIIKCPITDKILTYLTSDIITHSLTINIANCSVTDDAIIKFNNRNTQEDKHSNRIICPLLESNYLEWSDSIDIIRSDKSCSLGKKSIQSSPENLPVNPPENLPVNPPVISPVIPPVIPPVNPPPIPNRPVNQPQPIPNRQAKPQPIPNRQAKPQPIPNPQPKPIVRSAAENECRQKIVATWKKTNSKELNEFKQTYTSPNTITQIIDNTIAQKTIDQVDKVFKQYNSIKDKRSKLIEELGIKCSKK